MFNRMKDIMYGHLNQGELFLRINGHVEDHFDDLLNDIFDRIQSEVCEVVGQLGADVALLESVQESESDRFPESTKDVRELLGKVNAGLAGIRKDVEATKERFQWHS
jgi:hypothetical protein